MKTIQNLCLLLLEFLRFGQDFILYALIFVSAFFRNRASLGCELVAIRSQLTFCKENIRQKKQPRPRFTPAFRLLWVLLSAVWSGWKSAADLMQPKTVLKILSEGHLKRLLKEYIEGYYPIARPHFGFDRETPFPTDKPAPVTKPTRLVSIPVAGGLHHRCIRVAA